ncbi:MAG TPA: hypothetical protein VFC82_07550 [Actinomycetaceae bacterium]|nr:hypothetical protein [Actinomycetaceae bacterium]
MAYSAAEARRLAADPATDAATLYELAQQHAEVLPLLATNPSTYPGLLAWLGTLDDPAVKAALARRHAAGSRNVEARKSRDLSAASTGSPVTQSTESVSRTPASPATGATTSVSQASPGADTTSATVPPSRESPTTAPKSTTPSTTSTSAFTGAAGTGSRSALPQRTSIVPAGAKERPHGFGYPSTSGWTPTGPPLSGITEPQAPSDRPRSWPRFVAVGLGLLVLIVAGIWLISSLMGGRSGEETPTAVAPVETPTATATEEPTTASPTGDAEARYAAVVVQIGDATASTACTDVAADSEGLINLAAAAQDRGGDALAEADGVARNALEALQSRCNAGYAAAVAESAATSAPQLAALESRDWVVPTAPAPEGALELANFQAPSANIVCSLGEAGATCSILDYSFDAPDGCNAGSPVTLVVDDEGARTDCSAPEPSGGTALAYGSTSQQGRFHCDSEESGIRCWDSWSGANFQVARAQVVAAEPVFAFEAD